MAARDGRWDDPAVTVSARGDVPQAAIERAKAKVAESVRFAPRPVRSASVVFTVGRNPATERPVLVEVGLDVDGTPVRARIAADDPAAAVDLVDQRLRRRLAQLGERLEDRRRNAEPAVQAVPQRLPFRSLPPDERTVVRRKTFAVAPLTLDEAVFDMDLLDHDFYLFTDLGSGGDALVHRRPDGTCGVAGPIAADEVDRAAVTVTLEPAPPALTEEAAIERLDDGDEPFVFHLDPDTSRGRVVYRRYDGNYGVILAAWQPPKEVVGTLRARREEIWATMAALEAALAAPVPGRVDAWWSGVSQAVARVRHRFAQHLVETEGPDGLFTDVLSHAPHVAHLVEHLGAEHVAITDALAALAGRPTPAGPDEAADAREQAVVLLGQLARHRQHGADLLYTAYSVDVGPAD